MTLLDRALRVGGAGGARRLDVAFAVYLLHAAVALTIAWPLSRILADPVMAYPRGDRLLFDPGGLYLVEALRLTRSDLTYAAEGMSFGALLALYLGLLPLGALIRSLGAEQKLTPPALMAHGVRFFGPMSLLLGLSLVIMALACGVPIVIGSLLDTKIRASLGDRGGDLVEAAFYLVALGVLAVIGVVHDLARTAAVTRELPALQAARAGARTLRAWPAEAFGGWALRGLLALLLVTAAARTTTLIGIETNAKLVAVALVHQAAALALVFLRADWLALATRLVRADEVDPTGALRG
jgi:hypothetical protein